MKSVEKKVKIMKWLRWAGILPGVLMYEMTAGSFGSGWATVLAALAAAGFYYICDSEGRRTMCQFVADDLKQAVQKAGLSHCVVEIRSMNVGLITRVYLIGAGSLALRCNRAVLEQINRSWYKKSIWITQILELEHESELAEAQEFLDDALLEDIKKRRGERNDR